MCASFTLMCCVKPLMSCQIQPYIIHVTTTGFTSFMAAVVVNMQGCQEIPLEKVDYAVCKLHICKICKTIFMSNVLPSYVP